jgi:acyl dehydratase
MPQKYEHGEDYRVGLYFQEFEIGDQFETGGRTITAAEISSYLSLVPNVGEGHVNVELTDGDRVVHGLLTLLISQGLSVYDGIPHVRPGGGLYGINDLRWTQPVYVGDTIHNEEEIVDKEPYDDEKGQITYERRVKNQDDELVLFYEWIELAARKDAPE